MANVINSLKLGSGTYVFTTPYATCDTAAATAAKVATTTPGSNFSLETGARITVKFTVTNTAANPTLNVNSTGAKAIYYRGSAISAGYLAANRTYEFVYNGTQYEFIGDIDTDTNTNTSHSHNAGVGLVGSGSASTSGGTYTYKAKLKDETKNANDSLARSSANANRLYPVEVDKSGYLAVTVPWSDTDTTTTTGATDTSSKIFLVGATSQSLAPTTYSHDTAYVGTDGCLYSNSKKVATLGDTNEFTGTNTFQGSTTFLTASAGINDPKTHVAADGVRCATASGPSTHYMYGKITNGTKTLTLPSNKDGTIALTSDIPSTSSFATLSGNNTFTGITAFNNTVSCGTIISNSGFTAQNTSGTTNLASLRYDSIIRTTNNASYTLTIPAKDGTIALTSDIPSTSNFVTIANEQTITGKKIFNGGVQFGANTVFNNNGIQIPAANAFKVMGMYDISFPSKSGTIALTSDIPSGGGSGDVTAAGNNTFTGNNKFQGGTTSFMTAAGRPSDPVTTVDSDGVHCSIDNSGVGTHYQDNQIQNKAFTLTLPTKNGTLATTSDIPIKSATLSGTTLSITLS